MCIRDSACACVCVCVPARDAAPRALPPRRLQGARAPGRSSIAAPTLVAGRRRPGAALSLAWAGQAASSACGRRPPC
eukprot:3372888-Alexandrium_andersonii.AAC.1